ncbi:hypothetical protein, partial [Stenotrophomonas sp. 232]|uniref:hypothetical protein n=1 Tax=Stenotrophomonas sp. 232 TaxID=2785387 RepID=UPI001E41E565
VLNDLSDRLDLELIGVPLRAHNHLRLSHSLWLRGVYGTLGDSLGSTHFLCASAIAILFFGARPTADWAPGKSADGTNHATHWFE